MAVLLRKNLALKYAVAAFILVVSFAIAWILISLIATLITCLYVWLWVWLGRPGL